MHYEVPNLASSKCDFDWRILLTLMPRVKCCTSTRTRSMISCRTLSELETTIHWESCPMTCNLSQSLSLSKKDYKTANLPAQWWPKIRKCIKRFCRITVASSKSSSGWKTNSICPSSTGPKTVLLTKQNFKKCTTISLSIQLRWNATWFTTILSSERMKSQLTLSLALAILTKWQKRRRCEPSGSRRQSCSSVTSPQLEQPSPSKVSPRVSCATSSK